MEPTQKIDQQAAAMCAVADLARTYGHLPAAKITVWPPDPDQVEIALHRPTTGDPLAAWEAWRTALGIDATACSASAGKDSLALRAEGTWCGTPVTLVAYGDSPSTLFEKDHYGARLLEQQHQIDEQDAAYRRIPLARPELVDAYAHGWAVTA